jgi:hypothetical protein
MKTKPNKANFQTRRRFFCLLHKRLLPAKARKLARRLEIHYTPKHGSWPNIAETELSVLSRQYLDQRIESIERVESECHSWNVERNKKV